MPPRVWAISAQGQAAKHQCREPDRTTMVLRKKVIHGLTWSAIAQSSHQLTQLIVTSILARLLSPYEFGLMGMVTVFTGFALIFNDLGLGAALIQKQDADERHYSSAFWITIAAGFALVGISCLSAAAVAGFYDTPLLASLIKVVSINFVFLSLASIPLAIFQKHMNFRAITIAEVAGVALGGVSGILSAVAGLGVWSLIVQILSTSCVYSVSLWLLSSWRPRRLFSPAAIKEIFNFGANYTGFYLVNYFSRTIDQLLIGKYIGSVGLGIYAVAYKIMLYPLRNVSHVISKVLFPAFSIIQKDREKFGQTYLRMIKAISLITFPLCLCLFAVAPPLVRTIFGCQWEAVIPVIRILSLCGFVQSLSITLWHVFLATDRADLQFKLSIADAFFVAGAVIIGLRGGIVGVACWYTLEQFVWAMYLYHRALPLIHLRLIQIAQWTGKSLGMSVVMAIGMLGVTTRMNIPEGHKLVLAILVGVILYGAALFLCREIRFAEGKFTLRVLAA